MLNLLLAFIGKLSTPKPQDMKFCDPCHMSMVVGINLLFTKSKVLLDGNWSQLATSPAGLCSNVTNAIGAKYLVEYNNVWVGVFAVISVIFTSNL